MSSTSVISQQQKNHEKIRSLTFDARCFFYGDVFIDDYYDLLEKLNNLESICSGSSNILPDSYKNGILKPFYKFITNLGSDNFCKIFQGETASREPDFLYSRRVIPFIATALLQRNYKNNYYLYAYDDLQAFQEIVSDLYLKMISKKVSKFVQRDLPPLVKWGQQAKSPRTYPFFKKKKTTDLPGMNINVGIVSLPSGHRSGGLVAWASLAHEVAGHNFLHTIPNLLKDLTESVAQSVEKECRAAKHDEKGTEYIVRYWKNCVEESASDVLGCLTMGPTFAIGLLGYLRATRKDGRLSNETSILRKKIHPPPYLRAIGCVNVIENFLKIKKTEKDSWIKFINSEIQIYKPKNAVFKKIDTTDPENPKISEIYPIEIKLATAIVKAVTSTIAKSKLKSIKGSLVSIKCWNNIDEGFSYLVQKSIEAKSPLQVSGLKKKGFCATHILAGSITASIKTNIKIEECFKKMKKFLLDSHKRNPLFLST